MELQSVSKELAIIKPTQQRILGLQTLFSPLFDWQATNLAEVKQYAEDADYFIISSPTIDDLPRLKEISDKLEEARAKSRLKSKERLDFTKNFDTIKKRTMVIEESYEEIAKKIEPGYIALKKIEQFESQKVALRNQELNQFRLMCQTEFNRLLSLQQKYIQSKVSEVYEEALDMIDENDIKAYLDDLVEKHKDAFKYLAPKFATTSDADKKAIYKDVFSKWSEEKLLDEFAKLLQRTFSDFEIAKIQKEAALKVRESEKSVEIELIEEIKETNDILAVLDEKSAEVEPILQETKSLKQLYSIFGEKGKQLDGGMDKTEKSLTTIERAFFACRRECMPLYQGKDIFNIDGYTKASLLSKLKNKDNKFEADGIIFCIVDKI